MERLSIAERPDWQRTIEAAGLTFWPTPVDGTTPGGHPVFRSYWADDKVFRFTEGQVDLLGMAAERTLQALVGAVDFVLHPKNEKWLSQERMDIPPFAWAALRESWRQEKPDAPSVFGRFDVVYGGGDRPWFLEYNADTPTSLLEAAVVQWQAFEQRWGPNGSTPDPTLDQWNNIHETLLAQWTHLRERIAAQRGGEVPVLYLSCVDPEFDTGEDRANVDYMESVAKQAGWKTKVITQLSIRYVKQWKRFGHYDPVTDVTSPIEVIFKLYPWEWIDSEDFGPDIYRSSVNGRTIWIEPPYKGLLSNKAIWAAAWELYEDDSELGRFLLPTFFAGDRKARGLIDYVSKPIKAREGAGVDIHVGGEWVQRSGNREYDHVNRIVQQYVKMPVFAGYRPVLGVWMCASPEDGGDVAVGMGIREDRSLTTGNGSTFVPHCVIKGDTRLYIPSH